MTQMITKATLDLGTRAFQPGDGTWAAPLLNAAVRGVETTEEAQAIFRLWSWAAMLEGLFEQLKDANTDVDPSLAEAIRAEAFTITDIAYNTTFELPENMREKATTALREWDAD